MKNENNKKAIEMIVLAVKVVKPELTDEQTKNVIVNVGNLIQLERIETKDEE